MGHTALMAKVRRTSWRSLALAGITSAGPLGCGAVGPEHPAAQGGSAQGGSAQGGSVGGVEEAPAGSAGLPAGGRRAIGSDSHLPPPQGNGGAQPDLAAQAITRDSTYYYYVTYCNNGTGTSGSTFTIKLTNTASDESFTSNALYPFAVPAPGTCATTGGFTCGLIGDPTCSLPIAVSAKVDPDNTVLESNELNNAMIVSF